MYVCICLSVYSLSFSLYIYISLYTGNYVASALLYSAHVFCFHGHRVVSGALTIILLFLLGYRRKRKKKKKKSFPRVPSTSHPSRQRAWERWSLGQLITTGIKLKFVTKKKERKDYSTFFLFLLFIDKRTVFLLLRMIYFNHSTCKRNAPLMG